MADTKKGSGSSVPRGLEILIKKAAVDKKFRHSLVTKREKFADELNIPLEDSERLMLSSVSANHLEMMIGHTDVPEKQKTHLAKASTATIVALIAQLTFGGSSVGLALGNPANNSTSSPVPPELAQDFLAAPAGIRPDRYEHLADRGVRPDSPSEQSSSFLAEPVFFQNSLPDKKVETDLRGLSFEEAIKIIAQDTGIEITHGKLVDEYAKQSVKSYTDGLSITEALKDICAQYVDGDYQAVISYDSNAGLIDIQFFEHAKMKPTRPGFKPSQPPVRPPTQNEDRFIRGSRAN